MSETGRDDPRGADRCPRCGAPAVLDSAACPQCLLSLALDSSPDPFLGQTVSHYQVLEKLGAGGMGEVYRAHDTRLERNVALKILPETLADDPDRLARLQREARMLASVDHANVAHVYEIEELGDTLCIVMEMVDGEGLDEIVSRGPVPLDEALALVRQVGVGLEAAHAKGIMHRDLKPANVKIRSDGVVKVLDFGLAKAVAFGGPDHAPAHASGAIDTAAGMILGTPSYMSPEQLKGKPIGKEVDVWAFGCLLYELLTGDPPFGRGDTAETIAAVLRNDPDFSRLPSETPSSIRRLLSRCLEKDVGHRLPDLGSARLEIDEGLAELATPSRVRSEVRGSEPPRGSGMAWIALTAVGVILAGVLFVNGFLPDSTPARFPTVVRLDVPVGAGQEVSTAGPFDIALSPDGTMLAYTSGERPRIENLPYGRIRQEGDLYVRPLDRIEPRRIPGTRGALMPFFSPDGEWIGFRADGKLKKVAVEPGGVPEIVSDVPPSYGAAWSPDGYIYYSTRTETDVLVRVPESGGTPEEVTRLDESIGESAHRWPQVIAGGRTILLTVLTGPGWDERHLHALDVETGERRLVIRGASTGQYLASGHIVYAAGPEVRAVRVDPETLDVTGTPFVLEEAIVDGFEGAPFVVSPSGSLAYVPQGPGRYERDLVWVSRDGTEEVLGLAPAAFSTPSISPDGRLAAFNIAGARLEIWIYDFARAALYPLSAAASTQAPVWTPDSRRVAYRSSDLYYGSGLSWKLADGSGDEELLTVTTKIPTPGSFSSDGRWLAYEEDGDSWILPVDDPDREPRALLENAFSEVSPRISPDGRRLAYESDETGALEIYVRPFPDVESARWLISPGGGSSPLWARDGQELFYRGPEGLMAVPISTSGGFSPGSPRMLFEDRYMNSPTGGVPGYDVSSDGSRFLFVRTADTSPAAEIRVVLDWYRELLDPE